MSEKKRLISVRWWVAFWLFLSNVIWYLDRTNISVASTHIMKEYGWNPAQFGIVMSAFFLGYALTQIPGGWLSDRFGGSRVIQFGTIWWSIFTILTPAGMTVATMAFIRCLMGLGEGVNAPAHVALTAHWMPRREFGRASGLYLMGTFGGIMLTMPIAAWITLKWGWQWVFYSFGAVGFIWSAIWFYYGRDNPEQHPKISKEEIELIRSDQESAEKMKQPTDWKRILGCWQVWGVVISFFAENYGFYLYVSWLPGYLMLARGYSLSKTAYTAAIPFAVSVIASALSGVVSDKLTQKYGVNIGRRSIVFTGFLGAAFFTILSGYTASNTMVVVYLTMAVAFLAINHPMYYAMPIDISPKDGGVIYGMINTSGTIAGVVAPALTGFIVVLSGSHWEYALYFAAFVCVLGAIMISLVKIRGLEYEHDVKPAVIGEPAR